jgi:hypothetical protein
MEIAMRHLKILFMSLLAAAMLATTAFAQTPPKPSAGTKHPPAKTAPAPATLTDEQLSIAQIVHTGRIACADGQSVTITPDAKMQGAFDLKFGSAKYGVVPMPSKSGAVRLENKKTGVVYMQLANKSMLFNERQNRRLADNCINDAQRAVADTMRTQGAPGVLDGPAK